MKRNCNLELGLSQPAQPPSIPQEQLTIFYDGRISVCDVTKLQASAIITEASKQMDPERSKWRSFDGPNENGYNSGPSWSPISPTSLLQSQLCSPYSTSASTSGMSMKKSLERFLLKRKDRQLSKR